MPKNAERTSQDQQTLALVYAAAAQDPDFLADNEAVEEDFAALDHEVNAAIE